jgi:membrane protein DedA with SNARE-associated domain
MEFLEGFAGSAVAEIEAWDPFWAYAFLLVSAFVENVIPPVPGDAVVVFSAYLVGRGVLDWLPVYAVTCAGGTGGFAVVYLVGRTGGRALMEGRAARLFPAAALVKAEAWLSRYGLWLIFANRFLSGIRSVIALSAGIGRMDWRRVILLALVSMGLWNGALMYAGMSVGENWGAVVQFLRQYNLVALSLLALGGMALGFRYWLRSRRS